MNANVINEGGERSIICQYRYSPHSPMDGYYEMRTQEGEFLGNIDQSELMAELRSYQETGYSLSEIKGEGIV